MPTLDIGALRHAIVLDNLDGPPVANSDGSYTQAYLPLVPIWWASITPATARDLERTVAGTVQSTATHLMRMRYLPGVTTQTRIRWKGRTFSVTGVMNPEEADVELVLAVVEVVT